MADMLVRIEDAVPLSVSAAGGVFNVSAQGGALTVSAAGGVFNVSAQGGALTVSANTGRFAVHGVVSAAAADAGNPVKVGFRAATSNPTAVANAQIVDGMASKLGMQVVQAWQIRENQVSTLTAITSTVATTNVVVSAGATTFQDITSVMVANLSATVATVNFRGDQGGAIIFVMQVPANSVSQFTPTMPIAQVSAGVPWTANSVGASVDLRVYMQSIKNL